MEAAGEEPSGFSQAFGGQAGYPDLNVRSLFRADYWVVRFVFLFHRVFSFPLTPYTRHSQYGIDSGFCERCWQAPAGPR